MTSDILWQPSADRIAASNLTAFMAQTNARFKRTASDYAALHRWSIEKPEEFWPSLIAFASLKAETWGDRVLVDGDKMPGAKFFPDARLNFAENLLRRRDDSTALVFWGETKVKRRVSWSQLHDDVARIAQALKACGVKRGDRVAGYIANMPEAVIAMLATASLGATWCSCSPDFGVDGVVDRFGQIEPKVFIAVDGYFYNGKSHDCLAKIAQIQGRLPSVTHTLIIPYVNASPNIALLKTARLWTDVLADFDAADIAYEQVPFNHPLYIMFSSGTTGVPKCIVHGHGGTLLKEVSEHLLHCDAKRGDRVFYFTTCGWMMWNWLVAALATEATLLLYDGSPFYPNGHTLFAFAAAERATMFGTSAKFIDAVRKDGMIPAKSHDLTSIRTLTSTGSPLAPEAYDFVYEAIAPDCHLASISGGTDILGCFVIGNPISAVRRGEIQVAAMGDRKSVV